MSAALVLIQAIWSSTLVQMSGKSDHALHAVLQLWYKSSASDNTLQDHFVYFMNESRVNRSYEQSAQIRKSRQPFHLLTVWLFSRALAPSQKKRCFSLFPNTLSTKISKIISKFTAVTLHKKWCHTWVQNLQKTQIFVLRYVRANKHPIVKGEGMMHKTQQLVVIQKASEMCIKLLFVTLVIKNISSLENKMRYDYYSVHRNIERTSIIFV